MWKLYSIVAAVLIGVNNVLYKYVLGLKKEEYVLYGCFIAMGLGLWGVLYLTAMKKMHLIQSITTKRLCVLAFISFFFFSGIIMFYKGLPISPNISLNTSLFAGAKITSVLLMTCLFFGKTLSMKQIVSMILILSGIIVFGL